MTAPPRPQLHVWRHPRPEGAAGRCIGAQTDLPVHWRRAKRLARRIQAQARRQHWPHVIHCSPLRRCADVGRWLKRWGWQLCLDPALLELNFGSWDGKAWANIPKTAVDAWVADFSNHAPGGGESLAALLQRVAAWQPQATTLAVSHGGWMLAHAWLVEHGAVPPCANRWPAPPGYGECRASP
ncbi:histidine phosphatase family protein [Roseateles koreensis]|uniref:Histidine phosphatase family protein n=1 Tax=Roseateles koreensis TaxID=2987526 RepID=A0ABT5KSF5_9BURK|nr:histidine phosphatase family protein [Roseateles koreensis]MDC8785787.1 histidine phosphatase family protein [Roseateles koreensis]